MSLLGPTVYGSVKAVPTYKLRAEVGLYGCCYITQVVVLRRGDDLANVFGFMWLADFIKVIDLSQLGEPFYMILQLMTILLVASACCL